MTNPQDQRLLEKELLCPNIKILSQLLMEIGNSPFQHKNTRTCSIFVLNENCPSLFWVVQRPESRSGAVLSASVSAPSSYWASQFGAQSYDLVYNWVGSDDGSGPF